MTTNVFFDNYKHPGQQKLINDLVIESIKIYGFDVYYLPRTTVRLDLLFTEDYLSKFEHNYSIEMFILNVEGFQGEGDIITKFGLEIRDSMNLAVSRTRFEDEITLPHGLVRPREGDLIYFPLNEKIFEIKFVEHEPVFYQQGALQFYNLSVELFEFSDHEIDTGLPQIDSLDDQLSLDYNRSLQILLQDGTPLQDSEGARILINGDPNFVIEDATNADNTFLQNQGDNVIDFSESDPFSEGGW